MLAVVLSAISTASLHTEDSQETAVSSFYVFSLFMFAYFVYRYISACLTLTVLVMTIDALQHFETG